MAKRPAKPELEVHWTVFHIAAKQKFVGFVHDQPDEQSAIKAAIEEYKVPPNERGRLMAQRRERGTIAGRYLWSRLRRCPERFL
jgi:hypothetical protein